MKKSNFEEVSFFHTPVQTVLQGSLLYRHH